MAIEFRRGTEAERLQLSGGSGPYDKPADGEPLWVSNTEKLYIGNGTGGTTGGILIGPITDFSELTSTGHTHGASNITGGTFAGGVSGLTISAGTFYSGNNNLLNVLSQTGHTHNYTAPYTNVVFDRITATTLIM